MNELHTPYQALRDIPTPNWRKWNWPVIAYLALFAWGAVKLGQVLT